MVKQFVANDIKQKGTMLVTCLQFKTPCIWWGGPVTLLDKLIRQVSVCWLKGKFTLNSNVHSLFWPLISLLFNFERLKNSHWQSLSIKHNSCSRWLKNYFKQFHKNSFIISIIAQKEVYKYISFFLVVRSGIFKMCHTFHDIVEREIAVRHILQLCFRSFCFDNCA